MRVNQQKMRQAGWGAALLVVALLFLFGNQFLGLVVEWLWFGEVGQRRVFWTILGARAQLALLFGVAFFLVTFLNVWLARRASPPLTPHYDDFPIRVRVGRMARTWLRGCACAFRCCSVSSRCSKRGDIGWMPTLSSTRPTARSTGPAIPTCMRACWR